MSNNKPLIIVNIILLLIIILVLLWFMFFGLKGFRNVDFKQELLKSGTYNLEEVNEIYSNLRDYDILVEKSDSDKVKVELYGSEKSRDKVDLKQSNGKIVIEQVGSIVCFGFCYSNNIAKIYIPEDFDKKVNLTSTSGDIEVKVDLQYDDNYIKTTSGDIKLDYVNKGKIYSTSGDIEINKAKNILINSTSGDIEISDVKDVNAHTTSGDIYIKRLDGSSDIKTTSGEIVVHNFNIVGDSLIESTSGDIDVFMANQANVEAKSVSGDKYIKEMTGEYNLKLQTVSGDIKVK